MSTHGGCQKAEAKGMTLGIMLISFSCSVSQQDVCFSLFIPAYLFHLQVGTGFSFTDHVHGYAIDEDDVAQNLYR